MKQGRTISRYLSTTFGIGEMSAIVMTFFIFVAALCVFETSSAQQVQLQQQIGPLECIYTTTQTGSGVNTNSTCDNQPIPLVTKVILNSGRPLLRGSFDAARSVMLRIWISGQWYTSGIDSRVAVDANEWTLDLSSLPLPLAAGTYTVIIEVETDDGLLLRNTQAATFEIAPPVASSAPPSSSLHTLSTPFFTTTMTLPQTQEGAGTPKAVSSGKVEPGYRATDKDASSVADAPGGVLAIIVSSMIIGVVVIVLYLFLRFKA